MKTLVPLYILVLLTVGGVARVLEGDEAAKLAALWAGTPEFFEDYAKDEATAIYAWMTRNDVDAALAYAREAEKPRGPLVRNITPMGWIAGELCKAGKREEAEKLRALNALFRPEFRQPEFHQEHANPLDTNGGKAGGLCQFLG